jgi:hypothetical protein
MQISKFRKPYRYKIVDRIGIKDNETNEHFIVPDLNTHSTNLFYNYLTDEYCVFNSINKHRLTKIQFSKIANKNITLINYTFKLLYDLGIYSFDWWYHLPFKTKINNKYSFIVPCCNTLILLSRKSLNSSTVTTSQAYLGNMFVMKFKNKRYTYALYTLIKHKPLIKMKSYFALYKNLLNIHLPDVEALLHPFNYNLFLQKFDVIRDNIQELTTVLI